MLCVLSRYVPNSNARQLSGSLLVILMRREGREEKGREGKGMEGKGREEKGREKKGCHNSIGNIPTCSLDSGIGICNLECGE